MSESQNLSIQLARALRARDEARKQAALEGDLQQADAEVERLKSLVGERLEQIGSELDGLRREQSAQEVRYKTGEYTEAQYRKATADVRRRISSLERLEESFGVLMRAEAEADVRHTGNRPIASLEVTTPSAAKAAAREELSRVRDYVPAGKGLAGVPAPKWMLIGSGVLVAVGAVAVVILLIQSLAGSFSLPSIPSPFQRDGGTVTAPSTPAPTSAAVAPSGSEFQVPVQLRGAQDVGSVLVELGYDAAAIEVVRVEAAALPSGTLLEYGLGQGRVSIGMVSSGGLKGDWVVAFITCRRAAGASTSGDSTILVSRVEVHRATDLAQLSASGASGRVDLSSLSVVPAAVTFG